jgi:hypothetical protein
MDEELLKHNPLNWSQINLWRDIPTQEIEIPSRNDLDRYLDQEPKKQRK